MVEIKFTQLDNDTDKTFIDNFYGHIIVIVANQSKQNFILFILKQYLTKQRFNIYIIDNVSEFATEYNIENTTLLFFKDGKVITTITIKQAYEWMDACKVVDKFPTDYRAISDISTLTPTQSITELPTQRKKNKYHTIRH